MKFSRIIPALVILFMVATSLFTLNMIRNEERTKAQELVRKGNYLVSILSLYPLMDFENDRREYFLKTLTEYATSEGLAYFFIHDPAGKARVSLIPSEIASRIPSDIRKNSLYSQGLTNQTFAMAGLSQTFYEFAKPIYEHGSKAGTIRLGFKLGPIAIFSLENISLLAMVAFIIFSTATFVYYGATLAIKPLRRLNRQLKKEGATIDPDDTSPRSIDRITPVIFELEHSVLQVGDRLKCMETDNVELASRLGVTSFEKRRVLKILDSITTGIIVTDIQENVHLVNEYVLNLLRMTREDVVDSPLSKILPQDEVTDFLQSQDQLTQTNGSGQADIILTEQAPGEIYRFGVSLYSDEEDTPIGKMITVKNVTKEKMTQDAQQSFIAHVAHELLTPLTNIKSYSEMLMDGEIEDAEIQKEFYNTINEQTDRLTDLIKNLLNVSKMEMGSLTIKKDLVRSDWLFEGCIAATEAAAQTKGITIIRETPHIFPTLIGDKELLKAAVINILGNAVKYTPENGTITFSITEEDDSVNLDVIDSGYGIARDDLPHVFDKFFRADNPDTIGEMGTGLGLAITSEIVHLHEGDIDVQSELGKGSHFSIRLPKEEYRLDNA